MRTKAKQIFLEIIGLQKKIVKRTRFLNYFSRPKIRQKIGKEKIVFDIDIQQ